MNKWKWHIMNKYNIIVKKINIIRYKDEMRTNSEREECF